MIFFVLNQNSFSTYIPHLLSPPYFLTSFSPTIFLTENLIQNHLGSLQRWLEDRTNRNEDTVTLAQFTDVLMNRGVSRQECVAAFSQFDEEGDGTASVESMMEAVSVTNGVKQGCVLAPTLFSMMFSAMLIDAYKDTSYGVDVRYRYDGGGLYNQARLKAKTKVNSFSARDFLFADDCALNACSEADMQASMDLFSNACTNFALTISTAKTEVLYQPAPGSEYVPPKIRCNDKLLPTTEAFIHLGSTLSM